MRSVQEHLATCMAAIQPLPPVATALLDALGCVLAEDVVPVIDMPRFDNSSMDGYAVVAAQLAGAAAGSPVCLPVAGDVQAGDAGSDPLPPGSVVRIMTGAPLPAGADAVVPVEWTDGGVAQVQVTQAPVPGQFVRRVGEDVRSGVQVLAAGTVLAARHLSLLAAVGCSSVLVRPRPRVLVLPSGNELVPPGQPLPAGAIHDSNGYGLTAAARQAGAVAHHGGIIGDTVDQVAAALDDAAGRADLVITTGGVSKGAYDTIKQVLTERGTVEFVPVAMQPGMPQGFGVIGAQRTPIFTLPGNPVSALVSFEVFVVPALRRLAGLPPVQRVVPGVASAGWNSPAGKLQFTRAVHSPDPAGGGGWVVRPVGAQGSHLVANLSESTCLAMVPEDVTRVEPGDLLDCLVLEGAA
jgi:molybdopterin molybdotransferase